MLQLKNDHRRALARYLEVQGPEAYSRAYQEWQATVRAIRRHLLPSNASLQPSGMTENARVAAGAEGSGNPPEPLLTSQTLGHRSSDLSFLSVDLPRPAAENTRENGVGPTMISGNTGVDRGAAGNVHSAPSEQAREQSLRAERDRQTDERSMAVAGAVIGVLEQAPDLFPGDRRSVAGHLAFCLENTESKKYADVVPAVDFDAVMRQCKPLRAAVQDGPTVLNFYMSWLWTAMARLAPEPEIRQRVARIIHSAFGR